MLLFATAAVISLVASVGFATVVQIRSAGIATKRAEAAQEMLIGVLDQETGWRGYLLAGDEAFLGPYRRGREGFRQALTESRSLMTGDASAMALLREQDLTSREWRRLARQATRAAQSGEGARAKSAAERRRKTVVDRFRVVNGEYRRLIDERRRGREAVLGWGATGFVLAIAIVFGGLGVLVQRRLQRVTRARENAYVSRQQALGTALQVAQSEDEAHEVLRRHLELTVPGSHAAILARNNSENRLECATETSADDALPEVLVDTEPRACLAIRLGARRSAQDDTVTSVLACEVCGGGEGRADCSPLVVGGEIIGSALVRHPDCLTDRQDRAVTESVAQAAPVLANLRNLALAEARAATDQLTGLPNRRAFDDMLKRMVARAGRTMSPLSALALDVDHFKQVNDTQGHDSGDQLLAALGALLVEAIRASDFAARIGGEEFIVLAPDTDRAGAATLAETIRTAVRGLHVPGSPKVTVSIGVASLPEDASTPAELIRAADRLLYTAKQRGRDRVEVRESDATVRP